nr:hypothetical protein [Clostridium cibarium]
MLDQYCPTKGNLSLSDEDLAQLLLVLETMATSIEQKKAIKPKRLTIIEEISQICEEINSVQEALTMKSAW